MCEDVCRKVRLGRFLLVGHALALEWRVRRAYAAWRNTLETRQRALRWRFEMGKSPREF